MKTEIILVRHGETELNSKHLYFGHLDPSLHKYGELQVKKTMKNIEDVDIIYSSDLKRCIETALIVNEEINKEIIETKDLRELNFGIFEGKSYKEICEEFPEESSLFFNEWKEYRIKNGESVRELYNRCIEIVEKILVEHKGKKVLIVTHKGCIQTILSHYICGSLDGYWKFSHDYGAKSKLVFNDDFAYLEYLNRI